MRTIGGKWKNRVKKVVDEANSKGIFGLNETFEYVKEKLPVTVFEIWEGAYSEIQRIAMDYNMEKIYRK